MSTMICVYIVRQYAQTTLCNLSIAIWDNLVYTVLDS